MFGTILFFLVLLLGGLVAVAVYTGTAVGLAWVLMKLLPDLTQFEAILLMMVATAVTLLLIVQLVREINKFLKLGPPIAEANRHIEEKYLDDFDELDDDYPIPLTRFTKSTDSYTGEAWFRYEIANELVEWLDEMERKTGLASDKQRQELAIRMTDPIVNILKRRQRAKSLTLTRRDLQYALEKLGQQPYDDDILDTVIQGVNERLSYDEDLIEIVRDNEWREVFG